GFSKTDFSKWVIDGLIGRQENVRSLPRILANPKSRNVFLEDGAEAALRILEIPTANASLNEATLVQLAQELQRRLARLAWTEFQRMKNDSRDECREALIDVESQLSEIVATMTG